jgi:hypothetical protein
LPGNFPFQGPQPLSTFIVLSGLYLACAILPVSPCGLTKVHLSMHPARSFFKVSRHFRVFPISGLSAYKPFGFSACWRSWLFSNLQRVLLQKCPLRILADRPRPSCGFPFRVFHRLCVGHRYRHLSLLSFALRSFQSETETSAVYSTNPVCSSFAYVRYAVHR